MIIFIILCEDMFSCGKYYESYLKVSLFFVFFLQLFSFFSLSFFFSKHIIHYYYEFHSTLQAHDFKKMLQNAIRYRNIRRDCGINILPGLVFSTCQCFSSEPWWNGPKPSGDWPPRILSQSDWLKGRTQRNVKTKWSGKPQPQWQIQGNKKT